MYLCNLLRSLRTESCTLAPKKMAPGQAPASRSFHVGSLFPVNTGAPPPAQMLCQLFKEHCEGLTVLVS